MMKITIIVSYVKENLTIFMTKKYKVLYQEVNLEWHEHREKSSKFLINHEKTPYAKLNKIIKGKQVRNGRKRRNN